MAKSDIRYSEEILSCIFKEVHYLGADGIFCRNPREEWVSQCPQFGLVNDTGKYYKIGVRTTTGRTELRFDINKKVTYGIDYFLLIAYDTSARVNPTYAWLMHGDNYVGTKKIRKLRDAEDLSIYVNGTYIDLYEEYQPYELSDKLDLESVYNKSKEREDLHKIVKGHKSIIERRNGHKHSHIEKYVYK